MTKRTKNTRRKASRINRVEEPKRMHQTKHMRSVESYRERQWNMTKENETKSLYISGAPEPQSEWISPKVSNEPFYLEINKTHIIPNLISIFMHAYCVAGWSVG